MATFPLTTPVSDLPMKLTQEKLKSLIHYDPKTGLLSWTVDRPNGSKAGSVAGGINRNGYIVIGVLGKTYLGHRLAWLYMTGAWPQEYIDHKNMVRTDNKWSNLRAANKSLNAQNIRNPPRNNTTGFLGVHIQKGKFRAQIKVGTKPMYLGDFATPELAHEAYIKAKRKYHEGCMI